MGKHDNNKVTENGQGDLDVSKTKDVRESGSGRHSEHFRVTDRGAV